MTTAAIMQPYFLPYIGYWQLLHAADVFLVLDDVGFIKGGWINRNRITQEGSHVWITVPLDRASSNKSIRETSIAPNPVWRRKMLTTLQNTYAKAPFKNEVLPLLEAILEPDITNLSEFLHCSIRLISGHIGLDCNILPTSSVYPKNNLTGPERILDLCQQLNATHYVNAIGGRELYSSEPFEMDGIRLSFIQTELDRMKLELPHSEGPTLSIIDLLMHNSPESVLQAIGCYCLVDA